MAQDTDPYRTLGLTRDATLDEVRRAYRRLAKANHPDAAGEAALPRFLAIQAAYDTIAGPDAPTRRPGAGRPPAARRPWDPDRDRAESTYRAYGGRPRRARPGGGPGPARGPSGQRSPGERAGTEGHAGPRPSRPARPPNKATLGSTSYDGAEDQPFEPDWGGASWYGTTSGTYWTLNPKEYADPRKHGPEYQARARRDLGGWEESEGLDPAGSSASGGSPLPHSEPGPAATTGDQDPRRPGPRSTRDSRPATHTTASWWEATAGHAPRVGGSGSARSAPGDSRRPPGTRTGTPAGPAAAATGAAAAGSAADPAAAADPRFDRSVPDRAARRTTDGVAEAVRTWLDDERPGAMGRIARAIVGWAPIALGIGWVSGEVSGCGRFAAGCDDAAVMSAWLIQVAVLVALLVLGRLARIASVATLATLAAAIPAALLLSATGSPDDAAAGRVALRGLLVIAWVVGLAFGTARELRGIGLGGRPVS
jgi:curved DNA-binding protein CbpA